MNSSHRRTLALIAAGLLIWGGWYGWQNWKMGQALNALEEVVRSADLNLLLSDPPVEVQKSVDLAIRGIHLSQGRDGKKSFDLRANWATLHQDSGTITVREPDILYPLKNEDDRSRTVHATSNIGRVEDGNQKISMSDDVRAQYEQDILTSDIAIFHTPLNKLTFPGGADLNGPELSGSCATLTWDLNTNILLGNHGVKMRWYPSGRKASAAPESGTSSAHSSDRSEVVQEASNS